MELWDIYDKDRNIIATDHPRGVALKKGQYHLAVHVWIRNKKGQFIISKRALSRPTYPHKFECVGGSVLKGEDSLSGAIREAFEEVGVSLDKTQGRMVYTKTRDAENGDIYNDIMDVWVFDYDGDIHLSKATTKEVESSSWRTVDEILALFNCGDMVDALGYFTENLELFTIK